MPKMKRSAPPMRPMDYGIAGAVGKPVPKKAPAKPVAKSKARAKGKK